MEPRISRHFPLSSIYTILPQTKPISNTHLLLLLLLLSPMAPSLLSCFRRGGGAKATASPGIVNPTSDPSPDDKPSPVLVELFSSQGCGTSPEAELLLSRLVRGDLGSDPPVAVLAFHVDYWDYRGWKDPFASSAWTVRQKNYVEALRLDTLYTPQVVVQGRAQCLGTDEGALLAAIRDAPRFPAPAMQATFAKPSAETLKVTLSGALGSKIDGTGVSVMVALYESGLVTDIDKGENRGRVMGNDCVVRRMENLCSVKDVSAKKIVSGSVAFELWEGFSAAKCGILVIVQSGGMHVFGCQQFQIPDSV